MEKLLSIKLGKLSASVVIGFSVMLVTFCVFMTLIYRSTQINRVNYDNEVSILMESEKIMNASDYLTSQARFYVINGNKKFYDNYWREVNETKTRDHSLAALKSLGVPDNILELASKAKAASDSLVKLEEKSFEAVAAGDFKLAQDIMLGSEYDKGKAVIENGLKEFNKVLFDFAKAKSDGVAGKLNILIISCTITIIALSILFIIFLVVFFKGLTSSISAMDELFGKIADGDLTVKAPVRAGESEIYKLFRSTNIFLLNISDILRNVMSSSEEVASSNNELASTMEELSSTFQSQASQVGDTASNMNNINDIVSSSVETLGKSSEIMKSTVEYADKGREQLSGLKTSMENIHSQTDSLAVTISKLSESSVEIGNIITVINDIADQTNLLALNAAIEAARAGEAGRGFAVVADEVRKLAERTQKATSEVESIISSFQKESDAASAEMTSASERVSDGLDAIGHTEVVFNEIFDGVNQVNENTEKLTQEVAGAYDVVKEVDASMQNVASGIEESSNAVSEVTSTVSHLEQRVESLKAMVLRFRV